MIDNKYIFGVVIVILVGIIIYFVVNKGNCSNFDPPGPGEFAVLEGNSRDAPDTFITNKDGITFMTSFHQEGWKYGEPVDERNDPGPVAWNNDSSFIGTDGELHLKHKLVQMPLNWGWQWMGAEAVVFKPTGYGIFWYTVQFVGGARQYIDIDFNTTFGAYTYSPKSDKTSGPGYCYPNICNEIDLIEWGKQRNPGEKGPAQWGIQPAYSCIGGPTKDKCNMSWDPVARWRIPRWSDLTENDWNNIELNNNQITFKMTWLPDSITFAANAGNFGNDPASEFPSNPRWQWSVPKDQKLFYPVDDGVTRLFFNLWGPGPIDGKEKEVIIKNIVVPESSCYKQCIDDTDMSGCLGNASCYAGLRKQCGAECAPVRRK